MLDHESFDNWMTAKDMMLADLSDIAQAVLVELEQTECGTLISIFCIRTREHF